jgi:hypothetical protein
LIKIVCFKLLIYNIFLATTSTTTTTCMPICLAWDCWINITGTTTPYSNIGGPVINVATSTQGTTTGGTSTLSDALLSNTIQDLQNENFRLKVGLGAGLGGGMAATSSVAAGLYIYFTKR